MNAPFHIRRLSFGQMILVGIAAGLPLAAQAGESTGERADSLRISSKIVVNYADLNLAEPAGAQTLYARLKSASRKVCGQRPAPIELEASMAYQDCYENALNKAVKRVNSQQLYALHAKHGGEASVG